MLGRSATRTLQSPSAIHLDRSTAADFIREANAHSTTQPSSLRAVTMEELNKALRGALVSRFGVLQALEDDTALFSGGLMDSLSVIELVSFIEEQIGCAIPPAEITLQNFDSISRIVRFTSRFGANANVK